MFFCSQVMSGSCMKLENVVSAERTRSCCSDCADAMPEAPTNKRSRPDSCKYFKMDPLIMSFSCSATARRHLADGCTLDWPHLRKFPTSERKIAPFWGC